MMQPNTDCKAKTKTKNNYHEISDQQLTIKVTVFLDAASCTLVKKVAYILEVLIASITGAIIL
jgi:hypothetical protein